MKHTTKDIINKMVLNIPELLGIVTSLEQSVEQLTQCFLASHRVLVCGNGGSAADAEHIVGELMKGFLLPRSISSSDYEILSKMYPATADYFYNSLQQALPVFSLVSQTALLTAFSNDQAADMCFAQQVLGYGQPGDILIALTTSGNSRNILYAAQIAHFRGMRVIAFTGSTGGQMLDLADTLINVPSHETYRIQEYHLPVYHAMCAAVENEFFAIQ